MEVEIKIYDETLKIQVEEEDLDRFIKGIYKKDKTIDESKWRVHPFYTDYEIHPEGYVRYKDTKVLLDVKKYRKEDTMCALIRDYYNKEANHAEDLEIDLFTDYHLKENKEKEFIDFMKKNGINKFVINIPEQLGMFKDIFNEKIKAFEKAGAIRVGCANQASQVIFNLI